MYESFKKGAFVLSNTTAWGLTEASGINQDDLDKAGKAVMQVCGQANASWTCTGEDIEDNGQQLDRDVMLEIEGTQNIKRFLIKANGTGTCEIRFELMK